MLRSLSRFSTGRRSKFAIVAIWVALGVGLGGFQPRLQDATTNENEAFLPSSAESTRVNEIVDSRFPEGNRVDGIVVYHRGGGLTAADRQRIAADARRLAGTRRPRPRADCEGSPLQSLLAAIGPFTGPLCGVSGGNPLAGENGPSLVSEDGTTALLVLSTGSETSDEIQANVAEIREIVPPPDAPPGELRAYASGVAGLIADSIAVFESIDVTLLTVTVSLVLVLLLLIYRSPVIALVPLFTVAIAYLIAAAAVYGLVQAGAIEVNGQTTSILIVLMFGAGTDYALLIVSRYREELRRFSDKHGAMSRATERTAPAILSAGGTVVAAMLVLLLADFKATQTMGPALALGVAVTLLAGLTLLPAILSILGRRAFWPAVPRVGSEQRRPLDVWRRIGHFVHERPGVALLAAVGVLVAGSFGNLKDRGTLDFGEGFRTDPESVTGQLVIEEKLSAGQSITTTVLAEAEAAEPVAAAVGEVRGVQRVVPAGASQDGELARFEATLAFDPFSDRAATTIPRIRGAASEAAGPDLALVGGLTAENHDTTEALKNDAEVIVPLVLALIFLILVALLRAVVAPLYLVATVVLSYGFAIGASTLIFTELLGQPDSDPALPTFAFIFLVALGVDYNIFLVSRIREEAARQETREAVITGLERTGGVITSAGLILAGTFSALTTLPLEALIQIGFTVAFGLLVDTFLVRTFLVPAIAFKLGERNWWPRRMTHGTEPPVH